MDCLERRALKRLTNEEVDYEILHLFQEERIKKGFFTVTQKFLARGSTNLCKSIQRNFKQNIILSSEIKDQPRKASGLAPKSNPEWYKKIDSILGDTTTDFNKLVSTSLERQTAKKLFKMTAKMNDLKITQTMIVTRTFTMIPKMTMNLIIQIS